MSESQTLRFEAGGSIEIFQGSRWHLLRLRQRAHADSSGGLRLAEARPESGVGLMASFTQKQWQEVEEILNVIVELFNLNRVPVAQGYAAISLMKRKMVESEPYLKEFDHAVDTCKADPMSGGKKIWEPRETPDHDEKVY